MVLHGGLHDKQPQATAAGFAGLQGELIEQGLGGVVQQVDSRDLDLDCIVSCS